MTHPNRRSTDPQESIVANGTGPSCGEVASPAPGEGSNAPESITAAEHFAKCGPFCSHVEHCAECRNVYGNCGQHEKPGDDIRWKLSAENSDAHGFTYIQPQLTESEAVRHVEGGVVAARAYPDAGEPDWKAECERLRTVAQEYVRDALGADFEEKRQLKAELEATSRSFLKAVALLKAIDRDLYAKDLTCFDELSAFLDSVGGR